MRKLANLALVCALLGCGARTQDPQAQETGGAEATPPATSNLPLAGEGGDCCQSCPLALEGAKLDYAETGGGAAMVFTTANKGDEEELRRRVGELAEYHNKHENKFAMLNHPHRAQLEPIDGGARIDLLPVSGLNEASGFRREVEHEVKWMQDGHCPPLGESNACVACDLPRR